ncbi:MAG: DNA polymerase III subunit delta [Dehalococcoidia bacterium]|nr:DNA polymerase III subunit delta [Dehalococcoidia bacterium]
MIYLFHGENDFLIQEAASEVAAALGPPDMVSLNTSRLEGAKLSYAELQQACDTIPFLAPARLVVVEGLLHRFESRDNEAPQAKGRNKLDSGWDQLAVHASQMPESTHLVLVDGKIAPGNPLRKALASIAQERQFGPLRGAALESWTEQRAAKMGARFAPGAIRDLLELTGDNLRLLVLEIKKLSVYAGDRPISKADVHEMVSMARETAIFALVDAVADKQLSSALRALHRMLNDGSPPPYLLFMLARQFRLLLLARTLEPQGVSGPALQQRLGIRSDYPFKKTVAQAKAYRVPTLIAVMERLLEADLAMKTGLEEPEIALELLVSDLCQGAGVRA